MTCSLPIHLSPPLLLLIRQQGRSTFSYLFGQPVTFSIAPERGQQEQASQPSLLRASKTTSEITSRLSARVGKEERNSR